MGILIFVFGIASMFLFANKTADFEEVHEQMDELDIELG